MSRESRSKVRMVGGSQAMREVRRRILEAKHFPWPVLVMGETGTGKTLAAEEIHRLSARRGRPFVRADLGLMNANLVESELFGHVEGAYTGATADRRGRFRAADGGTLFLDEVGHCPRELQAKLLDAVDRGEITPVGEDRAQKVDVRVISATNANLRAMVGEGQFRRDLLSRLEGLVIVLPPLRDRMEDLDELVPYFVKRARDELREKPGPDAVPDPYRVSQDAWEAMRLHPWPENVRELKYALQRGVWLASDGVIKAENLELRPARGADSGEGAGWAPQEVDAAGGAGGGHATRVGHAGVAGAASLLGEDGRLLTWDEIQRAYFEAALVAVRGNGTAAAKKMDVSRGWLRHRLQQLGIDPDRMRTGRGRQEP